MLNSLFQFLLKIFLNTLNLFPTFEENVYEPKYTWFYSSECNQFVPPKIKFWKELWIYAQIWIFKAQNYDAECSYYTARGGSAQRLVIFSFLI
jgi:hypothetical protein